MKVVAKKTTVTHSLWTRGERERERVCVREWGWNERERDSVRER